MKHYLLRYGEISLKGKNRPFFERKLVHNLKSYLKSQGIEGTVQRLRNRLFAETEKKVNWKPVFGLISYSPCTKIPGDYEAIQKKVEELSKGFTEKPSFRITAQVLDNNSPYSQQQLNEQLGALVVKKTGANVSLKKYEKEIGIEILQGNAYIYTKSHPCFGGLPVGVEGSVLLLIENEKSLLAGLMAMRRGCALFPIAKTPQDITLLERYSHGTRPQFKLLSEINLAEHIPRFELQALIVGDTLANFKKYPEIPLPILRPLIGYTEEKIQEELRRYR